MKIAQHYMRAVLEAVLRVASAADPESSAKCAWFRADARPLALTRTEGTVTKGAVNFAQVCANFANTMDLYTLLLPTHLATFVQIPHVLDLPRLFGSN